jgi:hypothetical protein
MQHGKANGGADYRLAEYMRTLIRPVPSYEQGNWAAGAFDEFDANTLVGQAMAH